MHRSLLALAGASLLSVTSLAAAAGEVTLDSVLAGKHRTEANQARDQYRHPKETLAFFGIKPDMHVIEITPGGGWYTEVLGPWLKGQGSLTAAVVDPASASSDGAKKYYTKSNGDFAAKLAADPEHYSDVKTVSFKMGAASFGDPGSADAVLTFRNVHNWTAAKADADMFNAFFNVLKAGGVLGVVEHRAASGTSAEASAKSGYIAQDYVVKLATDAGFVLEAESEINANPKDTKDHPNGVWTLPPNFAMGDKDHDKYAAIGESDRMTLRFRKPAAKQ
ncbi:methyltransferase [Ahniella affigens]|uniref:Methyltransferase n=1 Tax=Ahniella affigens TaxID=2021234 RepID=A0A2P1PZ03_9GAMM|nr:methyltransferase [Ahniella affigens]